MYKPVIHGGCKIYNVTAYPSHTRAPAVDALVEEKGLTRSLIRDDRSRVYSGSIDLGDDGTLPILLVTRLFTGGNTQKKLNMIGANAFSALGVARMERINARQEADHIGSQIRCLQPQASERCSLHRNRACRMQRLARASSISKAPSHVACAGEDSISSTSALAEAPRDDDVSSSPFSVFVALCSLLE